jgi:hypothetical protein
LRRVAYLPKLQRQAARRLARLAELVDSASMLDGHDLDRRIGFATIEAANTWDGFCRSFYLSCALGTHGRVGNKITGKIAFQDENAALMYAISVVGGVTLASSATPTARDEPDWHQVGVFGKIMRRLDPPNLSQVTAALSVGTTVFSYLQTFRNFYAHRSKSTAEKTARAAPRLRVSGALHPTQMLVSSPAGTSDTILRDWLTDLTLAIELME